MKWEAIFLPEGGASDIVRQTYVHVIMKSMKTTCWLIGLAVCGAQAALAGNITGVVTLKGTPPPERQITPLMNDANCGKLHTEVVMTKFYVVGENNGLGDVFVTLRGIKGKSTGPSVPPAVIDQKGCEYIPYILGVQTGQKIMVKNSDPLLHNVHPTPTNTAAGNKEANLAQLPGGPDLTFSFPAEENFLRFKCDVHPWMFSYVCVVDHPYFSVTDKDGKFTIKDVPPGKYTLEALHRRTGSITREIEVTDDGAKVDIVMEAK
jgi:hypothetical protein